MKTRPRLYLDSCCFIDLVKEQVGLLPTEKGRANDVWHLKQLMKAHRNGDVALLTSFLAVAEAVAIVPGDASVPQDIQDRFRRMMSSGQYVDLLSPTPKTGIIAQDLRWQDGLVLRGPDCLHIASAIEGGCTEFLTTDDQLQKAKIIAAIPKLRSKGISVISASDTAYLPDEYRQGALTV